MSSADGAPFTRDHEPLGVAEILRTAGRDLIHHARVLVPFAVAGGSVLTFSELAIPDVAGAAWMFLAAFPLTVAIHGAIVGMMIRHLHGRTGGATRALWPVIRDCAITSLVQAILVLLGFLLLIVPGLIVYTRFAVALPVAAIEGERVAAAFGRSTHLVKGRFWPVLGIVIVVILASLFGGILPDVLGSIDWIIPLYVIGLAIALLVDAALSFRLYERLVQLRDGTDTSPVADVFA